MSTLVIINAPAQDKEPDERNNYIGAKVSFISHSGFFYSRQVAERWLIGGGGYYYYDNDDGRKDSIIEYGLEVHYSIIRSGGFNFYALAGVGLQFEKRQIRRGFNLADDDSEWYQYGIGVGVMSTASSGFTINLDGGILRYRKRTWQNRERSTAGFGFGVALGYRF